MSAASQIVKNGGAIIVAAACEDGLPDHGLYASLLAEAGSPQGILDLVSKSGFSAQDQWQVQIQAQIQLRAEVFVYSDGLTDKQIEGALFTPCRDIEQTVTQLQEKFGPETLICVIPEGPQTIPYLRE
jgi:nickel-dependent lactate racemase